MIEETCPTCGLTTLLPESGDPMPRYDYTPGGHNDRHTLVVEAAERAASP